MNLKQYFKQEPYGAKSIFAEKVSITPTYLGLLIRKARRPSAELAKRIEKATKGKVSAADLRPDLFK